MQEIPNFRINTITRLFARRRLFDWYFIAIIVAAMIVYAWPYWFDALIHNYREIQTYDLDTVVQILAVRDALSARGFQSTLIDYGQLYLNLAIAGSYLYSLVFPITDIAILIILKLISLTSAICTITITYFFAKRYLGAISASITSLTLLCSGYFNYFASQAKPDMCQILFLVLSLYFSARAIEVPKSSHSVSNSGGHALKYALLAWAAAGTAFSVKYQGILLFPILAYVTWQVPANSMSRFLFSRIARATVLLAVPAMLFVTAIAFWGTPHRVLKNLLMLDEVPTDSILYRIEFLRIPLCAIIAAQCLAIIIAYFYEFDFERLRRPAVQKIAIFLLAISVFSVVFAVTSPWLIWRLQFFRSMYLRNSILNGGEWFGFKWLSFFFGWHGYAKWYVDRASDILACVGGIVLVWAIALRKVSREQSPFVLVMVFFVIFLGILIAKVNFAAGNYAIPLIPLVALLAAFGFKQLLNFAEVVHRIPRMVAVMFVGFVFCVQASDGWALFENHLGLVTKLSEENDRLGAWYLRCVPQSAHIITAAYSYAPPQFAHVDMKMGWGYSRLVFLNPDIVTINLEDVITFAKEEKDSAGRPDQIPNDVRRYYQTIQNTEYWKVGPTFGKYQVYYKKDFALKGACHP